MRATIPQWRNDLTLNTWAMEQDGPSFWRHASIGFYYLRVRDYQGARDALIAALRIRESSWIWNLLGVAEVELNRLVEARKAFRRALDLGTDDARSRWYLADVERRLGSPAVAADILEEGLRNISPGDRVRWKTAQTHYELALSYIALGRTDDAAAALTVALSLSHKPADREHFERTLRSIAPNR